MLKGRVMIGTGVLTDQCPWTLQAEVVHQSEARSIIGHITFAVWGLVIGCDDSRKMKTSTSSLSTCLILFELSKLPFCWWLVLTELWKSLCSVQRFWNHVQNCLCDPTILIHFDQYALKPSALFVQSIRSIYSCGTSFVNDKIRKDGVSFVTANKHTRIHRHSPVVLSLPLGAVVIVGAVVVVVFQKIVHPRWLLQNNYPTFIL